MSCQANNSILNWSGCAQAVQALWAGTGEAPRIAVVEGDDVMPFLDDLRNDNITEMAQGTPLPAGIVSANAYLGATPVAAALARGAQIVITGRVVDSALVLGILMHEFGWSVDDWDRLSAGSLCGHMLECGAQATGGLHTDWEKVPGWDNIGYPIAECREDGSFVITKPDGTGGLVTPAVLAEQMLYEISDPASYILPDVIGDFTAVTMSQIAENRVEVKGAKGRPAPASYKVSATFSDGYRSIATLVIIGINAHKKAQRTADAILARVRKLLSDHGLPDFKAHACEILGAEAVYGEQARKDEPREVIMRLVVDHASSVALNIFARKIASAGTSFAPGTAGALGGGRPKPVPVVRLFSFLLDKTKLPAPQVTLDGLTMTVPLELPANPGRAEPYPQPKAGNVDMNGDTVALVKLAWARSGDKGDTANIGVIARNPDLVQILRDGLTAERVATYFSHMVQGEVSRFEVPGINGFNFVLTKALDGGGMASRRVDPLGKALAQMLLDLPVPVPEGFVLP